MKMNRLAVMTVIVVAGFAAATWYPRFPGDLEITRAIQQYAGADVRWARILTSSASTPWSYGLLAIAVLGAWRLAGWRGGLLAAAAFFALWFGGDWLKTVIGRPRPSARLVRVVGSPSGYSCPSTFATIYAGSIGVLLVLGWSRLSGAPRAALAVATTLLLVAGGVARIVLGAHWASDVVLSYAAGFLFIAWWNRLPFVGLAAARGSARRSPPRRRPR